MSGPADNRSHPAGASSADHAPVRIVIIGAGFAGAYCAQRLESRLRSKTFRHVHVVVIDPRNYFIFYPFLIEAGTGALEPRHAVVSIRSFLRRAEFNMGEAKSIDFAARQILVGLRAPHGQETRTVSYDHLVLAPGSVTLHPPVPGLREHAFAIKELPDAVALRDRAIQLLEVASALPDEASRRRLLHWVIVGGSFTGAELAGEFHEFLRRVVRRYPNLRKSDCAITLVEREDRILRALHPRLSRYAEERMRKRGISIRLNETVREVHPDHIVLGNGERLEACTAVWCAGIAPPPLVGLLQAPRDERGYILCERDCRVRGMTDVWAIGDCAVNIDVDGKAYPATAQHAVREGRHVADNLARVLSGGQSLPFDYRTQGSLAALGCRTGVAEVFGMRISGFPAWWLWRTVYLLKMPGLARKARIAIDWTLDLFFRKDDVQLGVHEPGRRPAR
jgi:NADH dehydrogenase